MKKRRSLMKLATPLMLGRGIAAVFTFLIPVVLARSLDQGTYGTYKQFFLIASTVYLMGQLGLVSSLYYFIPRADRDGQGRVLVQTLLGLLATGAICAFAVMMFGGLIARRFSNPELAGLSVPLALYIWATLGSVPLEISLTTTNRTGWAGLCYVLSDIVRTASLVLPITLGGSMVALAWASAGWAFLRLVSVWFLVLSARLVKPHWPKKALVKEQLRYSLPVAGAMILTTLQIQLPQYVVASLTDAATYAIYAVGCLQIPLTDMLFTPVAEVMMVRLAQSPTSATRTIFREAVARLVMFFLPLTAFAVAIGPVLIPTLYTAQYGAAVPIFLIAVLELPLMALPVDGLLRSLDMTGKILRISAIRLALAVVCVPVFLKLFGLEGAMLGYVMAQWTAKLLLLRACALRLEVRQRELIPWREVGSWTVRGVAVFAGVTLFRLLGPLHGWPLMFGSAAVAFVIWGVSVWSARELRVAAPSTAGLSTPSIVPVAPPVAIDESQPMPSTTGVAS